MKECVQWLRETVNYQIKEKTLLVTFVGYAKL